MNKKTNILFLTNEISPYRNANSDIVFKLAETINYEDGFNCDLLGYYTSTKSKYSKYINLFGKSNEYCTSPGLIKKILFILKNPYSLLLKFQRKFKIDKNISMSFYSKAVIEKLKEKHYDLIVAFVQPLEPLLAISKIKYIPTIIVSLDPLFNHYSLNYSNYLKEAIYKSISQSDCVFVNNSAYEYDCKSLDEKIISKIKRYDLPCIEDKSTVKKQCFDADKINCVFCGKFYNDIRNPSFLFKLFSKLNDSNIVLHIFGHSSSDFSITVPNIIFHGRVSSEQAQGYMKGADILINVGNTNASFLPSKLLTYFSFGKPIINFTKIDDCPTLRFLEKYPLQLTISESSSINDSLLESVVQFCNKNYKCSLPYELIRTLYPECTVEYVANQLLDSINNSLSKK